MPFGVVSLLLRLGCGKTTNLSRELCGYKSRSARVPRFSNASSHLNASSIIAPKKFPYQTHLERQGIFLARARAIMISISATASTPTTTPSITNDDLSSIRGRQSVTSHVRFPLSVSLRVDATAPVLFLEERHGLVESHSPEQN